MRWCLPRWIHGSAIKITNKVRTSTRIVGVRYVVMNCARTIRSCSSIIRRMTSTVTRLLTIAVLARSHDHVLNVIVNWKIYCRFLHFNFLLSINQRRFWLLLRNRGRAMMIWICGSINEISHFWSQMIVMITRCSMPMMNATMRLTRILKMITTCRLSQISSIGFLRMSSVFSRPNPWSSLRTSCTGSRLINSN